MSSFRFGLPLLVLGIACSGPNGSDLFAKNSITGAAAGKDAGGSESSSAGAGSAGSQSETGGSSDMILSNVSGSESGGSGGGGSGGGGSGGSASGGSGGSGGGGGEMEQPPLEGCDMFEGAVADEDNGHCYRLDSAEVVFSVGRDACVASGGHLVTISDQAENDFVHALHEADHWLGGTDGRENGTSGVGTYTWVNGDEWDYTNWDEGQPNAVATNCPNENSGSHCFEHCTYQTEMGGWIDRACWHPLPAICEWELPETPVK